MIKAAFLLANYYGIVMGPVISLVEAVVNNKVQKCLGRVKLKPGDVDNSFCTMALDTKTDRFAIVGHNDSQNQLPQKTTVRGRQYLGP